MERPDTFKDVTGVILAGGKSSRMGKDKAMLEVGGIPLFERMLHTLQGFFENILISGDRCDLTRPGVPCYPDPFPGSALGGIYTGLFYAKTHYALIAPCDMPFPDPDLIRLIVSHRKDFDVVIPKTSAGLEPCFALYGKPCLALMKKMLEKKEYRIYRLFQFVKVRYLDMEDVTSGWKRSLQNINTPEDYCSVSEKNE